MNSEKIASRMIALENYSRKSMIYAQLSTIDKVNLLNSGKAVESLFNLLYEHVSE